GFFVSGIFGTRRRAVRHMSANGSVGPHRVAVWTEIPSYRCFLARPLRPTDKPVDRFPQLATKLFPRSALGLTERSPIEFSGGLRVAAAFRRFCCHGHIPLTFT